MGDFNAKIQHQISEEETCIGKHTFDKNNTVSNQNVDVQNNRERCVNLDMEHKLLIMNTFFMKVDSKLATYKQDKTHPGGEPFQRPKYEVTDYICVPQRWRNSVKNVESDTDSGIYSDHYPIKARIRIDLKAKHEPTKEHYEFYKCDEDQNRRFNEAITASLADPQTNDKTPKVTKAILKRHANEHIPKKVKYQIKQKLSKEARDVIDRREKSLVEQRL